MAGIFLNSEKGETAGVFPHPAVPPFLLIPVSD